MNETATARTNFNEGVARLLVLPQKQNTAHGSAFYSGLTARRVRRSKSQGERYLEISSTVSERGSQSLTVFGNV